MLSSFDTETIRQLDNSSTGSRRKYKIALGVGIGALVVGGVIIGLYFGGVLVHKSSSAAPALSCNAVCQQAYTSWQSYYNKGSSTPSTPSNAWIQNYNTAISANPSVTSGAALNQELGLFANLSAEEFANTVTKLKIDPANNGVRSNTPVTLTVSALVANAPASLDWSSDSTATSPVKDQAQCGGCWAFATAEAVESAYGRANNVAITPLSPQQIISCDTGGNDQGCNGGDPANAINTYLTSHPLGTDANYPFTDGAGQTSACNTAKQATAASTGVKVTGLTYATPSCATLNQNTCPWSQNAENAVISALQKGPITIAVDASGWNSYKGGIVDGSGSNGVKCTANIGDIDHAVQLVGYGTDNGVDYWKVKNQWTTQWGEKGYIRLKRGQNTCCVLCDAIQAITSGVPAGSPTGSPATNAPTSASGSSSSSTTSPATPANPCASYSCPSNGYCDASSGNAQCYCNSGYVSSNGACVLPSTSSPSGSDPACCLSPNCQSGWDACGSDDSGNTWCCPDSYTQFSLVTSASGATTGCQCGSGVASTTSPPTPASTTTTATTTKPASTTTTQPASTTAPPSSSTSCSTASSSATPNCATDSSGNEWCCGSQYTSISLLNGVCTCSGSSSAAASGGSTSANKWCSTSGGIAYACWQCQSKTKTACYFVGAGASAAYTVSSSYCPATKPTPTQLGC